MLQAEETPTHADMRRTTGLTRMGPPHAGNMRRYLLDHVFRNLVGRKWRGLAPVERYPEGIATGAAGATGVVSFQQDYQGTSLPS